MNRERSNTLGSTSTVKLRAIGQKYINGVSSRYEDDYSPLLENVVSDRELSRIIGELNDIMMTNWPCNACYLFGYACSPFTLGMSLLAPGYCAGEAEVQGQKYLRNVSLSAKFYDRGITFSIVKCYCDSYVEIRFPNNMVPVSIGNSGSLSLRTTGNGDLEAGSSSGLYGRSDSENKLGGVSGSGSGSGNSSGSSSNNKSRGNVKEDEELSPLLPSAIVNSLSGGRRIKDN
jgi:hypothetical protein